MQSPKIITRLWSAYRTRWWGPSVVYLALFAGGAGLAWMSGRLAQIASLVLTLAALVALSGILAGAIMRFVRKQIAGGMLQVLLALVCFAISVGVLGAMTLGAMLGPSEDGFADSLVIPADIDVSTPKTGHAEPSLSSPQPDAFQAALRAALKAPAAGDATVRVEIPSLLRLQANQPDALLRYLASNPAWRLFREHGRLYATRRWRGDEGWSYTLHGYYSDFSADETSRERFQSRLTLGLDGRPWAGVQDSATWIKPGESAVVQLRSDNALDQSWVLIKAEGWVVEVFEQSNGRERRLTKATLGFLERELAPLAADASWERMRKLLPVDAIVRGEPSLELRNSFQPGIYDIGVRVNPGEAGAIYLKAFEVTRGTPLSAERLAVASNERTGWSADPVEQFLSNTHVTIYEGDWGKPYAARFEVWFQPDSGAPARKLLEKVYKIEGWQR